MLYIRCVCASISEQTQLPYPLSITYTVIKPNIFSIHFVYYVFLKHIPIWIVGRLVLAVFIYFLSLSFSIFLIGWPNLFFKWLVIFLDLLEFYHKFISIHTHIYKYTKHPHTHAHTHQNPNDKWIEKVEDSVVAFAAMAHNETTYENVLHRMANKLSSQYFEVLSCGSHHFVPHAMIFVVVLSALLLFSMLLLRLLLLLLL